MRLQAYKVFQACCYQGPSALQWEAGSCMLSGADARRVLGGDRLADIQRQL